MKKIINGRRYDTDIAKEIGTYSYSNPTDFHHWTETLYRKRTGEFFLYGEGGPMSKYAESIGQNEWEGSQKITPVSTDAARKWAEDYMDADEYERIFGVIEEADQAKKVVSFSLTEGTIEKIARLAAENRISKSEVVERMFE